ncbi:acyl-CoA carboxylase epsilon subunit [Amycolatopsis vastitatis]|uniref:acyl-CoA carboxylase epsilon subunit n=1 Tax=Amycolatopsis vastitatis TaxID=1905142 RepID=UPI0013044364|nr:acyl-CoA carboxylase epsilon subunit [Amycolatopsis vastitatis]
MDGLRVGRGNPDDHELAALVAALLTRRRPPRPRRRSWWSRPNPPVSRALPGAWRRSGLPG